jgi:ABC-type Fe3+-siderophore transport system permease subunit
MTRGPERASGSPSSLPLPLGGDWGEGSHGLFTTRSLAATLTLATLLLVVLGSAVGSLGWEPLWNQAEAASTIVWDIRLPRSLGAWLAGALLGLAGAVAQGLFRNPLADPYLMGSATGAAFGVAVLLVLAGAAPGMASGWAGAPRAWLGPASSAPCSPCSSRWAWRAACSTRCACCWPA